LEKGPEYNTEIEILLQEEERLNCKGTTVKRGGTEIQWNCFGYSTQAI
jgi:hypothetical protein